MRNKYKKLKKLKKRLLKKLTKKVKKKGINRSSNRNRYRKWRMSVFKRDAFTCQRCKTGKPLNAHHKRPWSLFPVDRYRVSNGITLCQECHSWVHETGRKSEFLDLGPYESS